VIEKRRERWVKTSGRVDSNAYDQKNSDRKLFKKGVTYSMKFKKE